MYGKLWHVCVSEISLQILNLHTIFSQDTFIDLSVIYFQKILEKEKAIHMCHISSHEPLPVLTGFFFPF